MSKDTISNSAMPGRSTVASKVSSGSNKTGQMATAAGGAEADQGHIATRAYELYEQGGRQEGRALEDWLNAEQQMIGAADKL